MGRETIVTRRSGTSRPGCQLARQDPNPELRQAVSNLLCDPI
jgi:hypothetical protein